MPLRILLATIGSSGDVHPVIGLGRALKARGHIVTIVTMSSSRSKFAKAASNSSRWDSAASLERPCSLIEQLG
jgi:UDP:flavonoid glycosyltransferase YjiC (YdhE family)